jgi:hypothetical protein
MIFVVINQTLKEKPETSEEFFHLEEYLRLAESIETRTKKDAIERVRSLKCP